MPVIRYENMDIYISNKEYEILYWDEISQIIKNKYFIKTEEIYDYNIIKDILYDIFNFFCDRIDDLIKKENRFSFYLYCIYINEGMSNIYMKQIKEKHILKIDEQDFILMRRSLKIIIEQSVKYNLIGCNNFSFEIENNINEYIDYLDKLLLVTKEAIKISELIAINEHFNSSISIKYFRGNNNIKININFPYNELFKKIYLNYIYDNKDVSLSKIIYKFKEFIFKEYKISYDNLCDFYHYLNNNNTDFTVMLLDKGINNLKNDHKLANGNFIDSFFEGITLSKENVIETKKSIINALNQNRYIFRPILRHNIDGKIYYKIGINQWQESMCLLTINHIPFGIYPTEWKKNKELEMFFNKYNEKFHDKELQEPITVLLNDREIPYEIDIESFITQNSHNINIKNDIGDIDILFINDNNRTIYICECKNIRFKHDYKEYKKDYDKFKAKFEPQLERKINWANKNREIIQEHFKLRDNKIETIDILNYKIEGIFIINASTTYMYNGKYKCYTIHTFARMLDGENVFEEIDLEYNGKDYIIEYPYFDNVGKIFI
ncbi:hypothetical protein ACSQ7D_01220 [Capnocytophaga sp. G1920]|uniref:hypothetical protein n=1 Tax=Capnocytophaga sp. G1920 TaxID=3448875 RepID=UPI003EDC8D91